MRNIIATCQLVLLVVIAILIMREVKKSDAERDYEAEPATTCRHFPSAPLT